MGRVFHIIILILLCAALMISAGCGFPCSADNTGYVKFVNNSSTNRTYYTYVDNDYAAELAPGEQTGSEEIAVQEGEHEIIFKLDTGEIACSWTATIKECNESQFSCDI